MEKIIIGVCFTAALTDDKWHLFGVISILPNIWHDVLYDVVLHVTFRV